MKINYFTWYGDRKLNFCPNHFVGAPGISVDSERLLWIYENTLGRFFVRELDIIELLGDTKHPEVYFEDPAEATFFTLTWS